MQVFQHLPDKIQKIILTLGAAALLIAGVVLGPALASQVLAQGEPQAGTVVGVRPSVTFYPATYAVSGTTYSASPYNGGVPGADVTEVGNFNEAQIYLTADISGTATVTLTPQFSTDRTNWSDSQFHYISQVAGVTVVTGTAGLTSSVTFTPSYAQQDYQIILSADGSDYIAVPIDGTYMRLKMERTGAAGNGITGTVKVRLVNNGGS